MVHQNPEINTPFSHINVFNLIKIIFIVNVRLLHCNIALKSNLQNTQKNSEYMLNSSLPCNYSLNLPTSVFKYDRF